MHHPIPEGRSALDAGGGPDALTIVLAVVALVAAVILTLSVYAILTLRRRREQQRKLMGYLPATPENEAPQPRVFEAGFLGADYYRRLGYEMEPYHATPWTVPEGEAPPRDAGMPSYQGEAPPSDGPGDSTAAADEERSDSSGRFPGTAVPGLRYTRSGSGGGRGPSHAAADEEQTGGEHLPSVEPAPVEADIGDDEVGRSLLAVFAGHEEKEAKKTISKARSKIRKARKLGVNVIQAVRLIELAEERRRAGDIRKATAYGRKGLKIAEELVIRAGGASRGAKECRKCGAEGEPGWLMCPYCGSRYR